MATHPYPCGQTAGHKCLGPQPNGRGCANYSVIMSEYNPNNNKENGEKGRILAAVMKPVPRTELIQRGWLGAGGNFLLKKTPSAIKYAINLLYGGMTFKPTRTRDEYARLRQKFAIDSEDGVVSVARKSGELDPFASFRRERKPTEATHYDPTPNGLADLAENNSGLCIGCGKPLASYRAIDGALPNQKPEKTVAMHIPAKAVADDRGVILTEKDVFAGHWTCNALMSDCEFETPSQVQEHMPKMLAVRKVDWIEPARVTFVEEIVTEVRRKAVIAACEMGVAA